MKILINNTYINILSTTVDKDCFRIKTDKSENKDEVISLLNGENTILCYDNDNIIDTIESGYTFMYIEERLNYRWYVLKIPYTEEPVDEISALREQITNIELALCEIYESMGV